MWRDIILLCGDEVLVFKLDINDIEQNVFNIKILES